MQETFTSWASVLKNLPWNAIVSQIMVLAGVFLGGWVSPWVSNRIQKGKAKTELKSKLIKSVYIFFNLFRHQTLITNWNGFHVRKLVYLEKRIFERKSEGKDIKELQDAKEETEKHNEHEKQFHERNFDRLVEIESELVYLLSQIEEYYGKEVYDKVDSLITPHLDKSNFGPKLYEYLSLSDEEFVKLTKRFSKELAKESNDMAHEADTTIKALSKIK